MTTTLLNRLLDSRFTGLCYFISHQEGLERPSESNGSLAPRPSRVKCTGLVICPANLSTARTVYYRRPPAP